MFVCVFKTRINLLKGLFKKYMKAKFCSIQYRSFCTMF